VPAFTLAYRPQNVAELDHRAVRRFFEDLLRTGNVPHALLFSGPRGTGKTSAARILAKLLNCAKNRPWQPGQPLTDACGECENCREIAATTFLDLIEIDAASNRGIDDIRDLRERINLAPSKGRYKLYLVDEVHMLTPEAFNALLKTLEEPPPHAYFVLATTEPDRLPDTVRSRCVEVSFSRATEEEIKASLARVMEHEAFEVEPGVLDLIARAADGSFRDAQKLLERLSLRSERISLAEAEDLLSFGALGSARQFLAFLAARDTGAALKWVLDFVMAGQDPKKLIQESLTLIHNQLLALNEVAGVDEIGELTELTLPELTDLAARLNRAGGEMRAAVLPQLPLELAVVEWGIDEALSSGGAPEDGKTSEKRHKAEKKRGEEAEKAVRVTGIKSKAKTKASTVADDWTGEETDEDLARTTQSVRDRWAEIIASLKPHNGSISGLLRSCRVRGFDGKFLEIEAFYRFHHEKLQSEKVRRVVEKVLGEVVGVPMKVRCILSEKPVEMRRAEIANVIAPEENVDEMAVLAEQIFGVD
jgi:DNA polymerase-3 subunit gamma/tau